MDLGSTFSSVLIIAKDYEVSSSGKSKITYTVQLKQTVNPLAANREIQIKTSWSAVLALLTDFSLLSTFEGNKKSKDDRFINGLRLLLNKLPSIAKQKFIQESTIASS